MIYDSGEGRLFSDALSRRQVYVAGNRDARPSGAQPNCPFCPGGVECRSDVAPYSFGNRWPPIEKDRCELLVFGPDHDRDLSELSPQEVASILELAKLRTTKHFALSQTECVLIFENRGVDAGATVPHPHGQIFSFPFVPEQLKYSNSHGGSPYEIADEMLLIEQTASWLVEVPEAPRTPFSIRIVSVPHIDRLDRLDDNTTFELATIIGRSVRRLDQLFARKMPYHMWCAQVEDRCLNITISGLLRSENRLITPGAAEAATGLSFIPINPRKAAHLIRASDAG